MISVIRLTDLQLTILYDAQKLNNMLTQSERRVMKLATSGYALKEIAGNLDNSPKTIARHIESITHKSRQVYGSRASFRNMVVPELRCYYFLTGNLDLFDERS